MYKNGQLHIAAHFYVLLRGLGMGLTPSTVLKDFTLTRNLIFLRETVSVLLRWSASLPGVAMTT